ncbi:HemK family modification methylase [Rhodococcus triatomae BKS 15-14]|nr:HemK family modification methylase [Rhodococcus triatomae BKS 15-14]
MFAEDEARLLVGTAAHEAELADMIRARVSGRPLEQILGWAEFCGLRIAVSPGVFVPRRRTEFLVDQALAALDRPDAVVVDLCCGSGAVGAAIAAGAATGQGTGPVVLHAADVDPIAVACARRNAPTGTVHLGDLFDALPRSLIGRVDLLVVNAPYVPSGALATMPPEARLYEPRLALDGGLDGADVHRRVAAESPAWLAPTGRLLVETSERQSVLTAGAFARAGLAATVAHCSELDATVVSGRRRSLDSAHVERSGPA